MSLSNLYSSENPTVISQLSRIRAEADHMKKMGVPEAQIAQHLQGRYTGTDIPAEALYAMLKNLQPPAPKPNGDTIAVQAAKLVLQKAQQQQQPDINVQQLQGALQPPPPPQQQGAPQQGDPQYGQGSIPMQQSAQPGPAVQPMRKGGLADLPKPNVGSEKNFAKGGIVAFDDGGKVKFKDSYVGRGLQGTGDFLYDTVPSLMYDAGAGVWNSWVNAIGGEKVPYVNPFDPADKDRLDSWDNLLHPKPAAPATQPAVLQQAEKGSGHSWRDRGLGSYGRRMNTPAVEDEADGPVTAPAGPAAATKFDPREELNKQAQQPIESIDAFMKLAGNMGVEAGATSAQNRYGELATRLEEARNQAIKDSRAAASYEGARVGAANKGITGALLGVLANRAAAAKGRAEANKDYLASITGLTKAQVDLDVGRTDRAMRLREMAFSLREKGEERRARMLEAAAELAQRGDDAASQRMMTAAIRQSELQEKAELRRSGEEKHREDILFKQDPDSRIRGAYIKARDGDPANKKPPDPAKALALYKKILSWGVGDPDTIMSGGSTDPRFRAEKLP